MSDESRVYQRLNTLKFYATHIHPCSYLPQREAVTLFVDPAAAMDSQTYGALARLGFRRSGEHLYRPFAISNRTAVSSVPGDATGTST